MADSKREPHYRVYLLTVWQDSTRAEGTQWRFRLEDPRTGASQGFANPEALVAALQKGVSDTEDGGKPRP